MSKILIVDDDSAASAALARLLSQGGHEPHCAADAGAALTYLKREGDPDLMLLDLSMPGVNGLEALDAFYSEPRFAGVKIAVFTGHTDQESMAAARRLGAWDYLVKGMPWEELRQRIESLLRAETSAAGVGAPV